MPRPKPTGKRDARGGAPGAPATAEVLVPLRLTLLRPPAGVRFCLQRGRDERVGPVDSTGEDLSFDLEVRAKDVEGRPRFLGPFVQGPTSGRFVYVCSGESPAGRDHPATGPAGTRPTRGATGGANRRDRARRWPGVRDGGAAGRGVGGGRVKREGQFGKALPRNGPGFLRRCVVSPKAKQATAGSATVGSGSTNGAFGVVS